MKNNIPNRLTRYNQAKPPSYLLAWLTERGSLTRRILRTCQGQMKVTVLRQVWGRAYPNEIKILGIPRDRQVWCREVYLLCNQIPWVYARTVIPITTLRGPAKRLLYLGTRPLGAILFADPSVIHDNLEIFSIHAGHRLYQHTTVLETTPPARLWGRRSLFWISHKPLLVTEIFLPSILAAI